MPCPKIREATLPALPTYQNLEALMRT